MKAPLRRGAALMAALVLASFVTGSASATTTYSDYAVFGTYGVMIGAGSEVIGLVGARFNNGSSPAHYPGQPAAALNMNGGAAITGTANIGEAGSSADVTVANGVSITQLYYVDTFTHGNPFTGTATQQPGGTDVPAGTLAAESQWPGGLGAGCLTNGPDHTGLGNGFSLTLTPGSYGDIQGGGAGTLTFDGAGDYFINSISAANGTTIVADPGVRVFVCESVNFGSGTDVTPTTLLPGDFIVEVYGSGVAAGTNAFTSGGGNWIGNVLVPSRGLHYGNGSESGTFTGYMWADHVDIEHSLVSTKLPKKQGVKWNDVNGNGVRDLPDDVGLQNWTIQLRDSTNTTVVDSQVTDATGFYAFFDIQPGTYYVCEVAQAGWTQTYPNALTADPIAGKDVVTDQCPGPAIYGYLITVADGDNLDADDFGNHQEQRQGGSKSGFKFFDNNGDGAYVPADGDTPLGNWPINLYKFDGSNYVLSQSTTTSTDPTPGVTGTYQFVIPDNGTYRVCEGSQPNYSQTFPTALTTPPAGETITTACPAPNTVGYQFTIAGGENLRNNDFGNTLNVSCRKQTVLDTMNTNYPNNKGPDVTVKTWLGQSAQAGVDGATDSNGDGYIIVMVIAHSDGSLGGTAPQKVAVWKDYTEAKPFALFGCSVTLTGGGSDPSVWVKTSANAKNVTLAGHLTDIFLMDLHGANSQVAGVEADGQYRYVRNEYGSNSAIGILVNGNNNTVHNGAATGNSGDGLQVNGNSNYITDTNAFSNGGNGASVTGNSNTIQKLDLGDRGTGNTGDGLHVSGNSNTIKENDAFANGGDGLEVIGNSNILTSNRAGDRTKGNGGNGIVITGYSNNLTGNTASANTLIGFLLTGDATAGQSAHANLLKNNLSNTGASGSDLENGGAEWSFSGWIKNNGGGNKADGTLLANGVKGLTNFPASGATFNYTVIQTAE